MQFSVYISLISHLIFILKLLHHLLYFLEVLFMLHDCRPNILVAERTQGSPIFLGE